MPALRGAGACEQAADEPRSFCCRAGSCLASEVIPAQTFPVLYPPRGEAYRDPVDWYRSIDALRLQGRHHGARAWPPGQRRGQVERFAHRDAIQYVHDQTVRMNKG